MHAVICVYNLSVSVYEMAMVYLDGNFMRYLCFSYCILTDAGQQNNTKGHNHDIYLLCFF